MNTRRVAENERGEADALSWRGEPSVHAAREAMKKGRTLAIALPLGTHHALFRHLHPEAAPGAPETFETEGGPELLARIATVAGLAALAGLAGTARRQQGAAGEAPT